MLSDLHCHLILAISIWNKHPPKEPAPAFMMSTSNVVVFSYHTRDHLVLTT